MNRVQLCLRDIEDLVLSTFCHEERAREAGILPLLPTAEPAEEVLGGRVFSLPMMTRPTRIERRQDEESPPQGGDERVSLRLFAGLGRIAEQFWQDDVRALMRFTRSAHPALPNLHDAGLMSTRLPGDGRRIKLGYVTVSSQNKDLRHPETIRLLRGDPQHAIRQIGLLADGLRLMHESGSLHRNLWLRTVEDGAGPDLPPRLSLARFEMSALLSNLLRRRSTANRQDANERRVAVAGQGRKALMCQPPERLRQFFPSAFTEWRLDPEMPASDTYSLGLLSFVILVGDLDEQLLERAFPQTDDGALSLDMGAWRRLNKWLIHQLRSQPRSSMPGAMRDLIERMLAPSPRNRPTSGEVIDKLRQESDAIDADLGFIPDSTSYLVAISPADCQFMAGRNWIQSSPDSSEGWAEIKAFIETDLRGGRFEYAREGFAPYYWDSPREGMKTTRFVLRGHQAAYFATAYQESGRHEDASTPRALDQVLMIKYALPLETRRGRTYRPSLFSRTLPTIRLVPHNWPLMQSVRHSGNWRSWVPFQRAVHHDGLADPGMQRIERAFDRLLAYQLAELDKQQYAFQISAKPGTSRHGTVVLEFDRERDESRYLGRDQVLRYMAKKPDLRPPFGHFFGSLEDWSESMVVRFRDDEKHRDGHHQPVRGRALGRARVRLDGSVPTTPDRIQVRWMSGATIPDAGWLEPDDLEGNRTQHRRATEAYGQLRQRPDLLAQLSAPRSLVVKDEAWARSAQAFSAGGRDYGALRGVRSQTALEAFLSTAPLFALQGPPGTGKSTIASRAIRAALSRDSSQRILVVAQSHYALDHLALAVLGTLGLRADDPGVPDRLVAVRLASKSSEAKVDARMKAHMPTKLVERRMHEIQRHCRRRLGEELDETVQGVIRKWLEYVEDLNSGALELHDLLIRGANLVFATCGGATWQALREVADDELFDWVIVEEAAKAWPTELAVPLVRGRRWTLLGDQKQLPPYRLEEVQRIHQSLLEDELAGEPDTKAREELDSIMRVFKLFESLFDAGQDEAYRQPLLDGAYLTETPTAFLNTQFRMRDPIGTLVNRAFYGTLSTDPKTAGHDHRLPIRPLRAGNYRERSLVWFDTGVIGNAPARPNCGEVQCWHNPGEVELVQRLLVRLSQYLPSANSPDSLAQRIAVLTPYRDQVARLKGSFQAAPMLGEPYADLVHTVDSFQGREADIVVVSLVRTASRKAKTAIGRIGHLANKNRVNVMMSRARGLLVLVGRMSVFEEAGRLAHMSTTSMEGAFWQTICHTTRRLGHVCSARDIDAWNSTDG